MANTVTEWLIEQELGHLVDLFANNAIDWDILPELNNEDLKDLGIAELGIRKKILRSIAAITHTPNRLSVSGAEPSYQSTPSAFVDVSPEAEYRQLTVLFCDLMGSTELSRRINAEELRKIIRRYQKCCVDTVEPLGGFVARFMGDGVVVYFGYPIADETAPERAVKAGLEVVRHCAKNIASPVRVGIATGRVIIGDLLRNGPASERVVVGETPNFAARLQGIAQPNSVVISETTRRLAGRGFEFRDLGKQTLKGFDNSMTAWEVTGMRQTESRFASNRGPLHPLVGRETELKLLTNRWRLACSGEGQVVFISGEEGIGKSRLTEALRTEVADQQHTLLIHQCSPHHITSSLYPAVTNLQRAAKFNADDSADTKLDKIETMLQSGGTNSTLAVQLLAHLCSVPYEARYGSLNRSAQQIKALILEALVNQLVAAAYNQPVLFFIEDAHWTDPASLELFELLISRCQKIKLLIVVTHRLDWQAPLYNYNHISSLRLNHLSRVHCLSIAHSIADKKLSTKVFNNIVNRTDGNPLFIEELTKSLIEEGDSTSSDDIPETLQASLLSRIDRLGSQAKTIIQTAAVIGREFSPDLLNAVLKKDHNRQHGQVTEGLKQLMQAGLFIARGTDSSKRYVFKHALVQDSVYDTMLTDTRCAHHLNIAEVLVSEFPETINSSPEILAHHFTEAGLHEQAVEYWHQAGKRSSSRSANAEAIVQLSRAIDILYAAESSPKLLDKQLDLHIDLIGPLLATGGYSSKQVEHNVQQALNIAERTKSTTPLFPVLYARFASQLLSGNTAIAQELADEFLILARQTMQPDTIAQGHRMLGTALLFSGQPSAADTQLQKAAYCPGPESDKENDPGHDTEHGIHHSANHDGHSPSLYGQDTEAVAKVLSAWAKMHCGFPQQAIELFEQSIERARQLNHANTTGMVCFMGAHLFINLKLKLRFEECRKELDRLNAKHDLIMWRTAASLIQAWPLSLNGDYKQAISVLTSALESYTDTLRMKRLTPFFLSQIANAHLALEQPDSAIAKCKHALDISKSTGAYLDDPIILLTLAKAKFLKYGHSDAVEDAFISSQNASVEMKSQWYELRVTTEYAEYLLSSGRPDKALIGLQPIVDCFTEGHDLPDMIDARNLIDKLRSAQI